MHYLFLFITFLIALPSGWIEESQTTINTIDKDAVLKKTKLTENDGERVCYSRFKLENQEKIEVVTTGRFVDSMIVHYYSEGAALFASRVYLIADYFHKGAYYEGRPEGEITEIRKYYKTEQKGIQLKRSVDYFPNSNRDSLHVELQKLPFDTLILTNEDYVKDNNARGKFTKRL